jgi:hypothetical protein
MENTMNGFSALLRSIAISGLAALFLVSFAHAAKENVPTPVEYGVYAKTAKGLTRITTNIVYDDQRIFYLESSKPAQFHLNTIQYFVIYGKHDMQYLTLNNLKPFQMTPFGVPRFMFGIEVPLTVEKKNDVLYTAKPKGLFGRGYYALWINDSAWDFVID